MAQISRIGIQATYLINMDRRPDKRAFSLNELANVGIHSPLVLDAIDSTALKLQSPLDRQGAIGCLLSHRFCLQHALLQGYDTIFICEDDIVTPPDFERLLCLFLDHVPANWQMLMLGWDDRQRKKKPLNRHVLRPSEPYGTQAIIYRGNAIKMAHEMTKTLDHYDLHTERLAHKVPTYLPTTTLFDQVRAQSDIFADCRGPHAADWYVEKWNNFFKK